MVLSKIYSSFKPTGALCKSYSCHEIFKWLIYLINIIKHQNDYHLKSHQDGNIFVAV